MAILTTPRYFKLTIYKKDKVYKVLKDNAKVIFDTESVIQSENQFFLFCNVSIYGLNADTMNALLYDSWFFLNENALKLNNKKEKGTFEIGISAGYNKNTSKGATEKKEFFRGQILEAKINYINPNNTNIQMKLIYTDKRVNIFLRNNLLFNYNNPNGNMDNLLSTLAKQLGLSYTSNTKLQEYKITDKSYNDNMENIMRNINNEINSNNQNGENKNFSIKITKDKIFVYDYLQDISTKQVSKQKLIQGTTGMKGHPQFDGTIRLLVSMQLNTAFKTGDIVAVNSYKTNAGFGKVVYEVLEVQHKGDTRGADWTTNLSLISADNIKVQSHKWNQKNHHTE